ncbi:PCMTD1, partial [Symbiodinium pilosum]
MPLKPGMSFLNIGSGTGYFSCLVAEVVGECGVNDGLELWPENVAHAQERCLSLGKHHIEFNVGNVYQLDVNLGMRYDRIYAGMESTAGRGLLLDFHAVAYCTLQNIHANPEYLDNVASNDRECCDQLCSTVQCNATHAVPTEKKDKVGASPEECCEPKCSQHACFGSWATDESKLDKAGQSDEQCCTPSCAAFVCDKSEGFQYVAERHDKAQPVENPKDFCCQKTCGFYKDRCEENHGVDTMDKVKMATAATDANFKDKCCEPKCSSVTCEAKHHHDPTYLDYLISKVPVGSSCCIPTCAAYSCSKGWTSNPAVANFVSAGLTDEECCLPTCALHKCGKGWFNSTNQGKLMKVSKSDAKCCEPSCKESKEFQCRAGFAQRPSAETTPATGHDTCC